MMSRGPVRATPKWVVVLRSRASVVIELDVELLLMSYDVKGTGASYA